MTTPVGEMLRVALKPAAVLWSLLTGSRNLLYDRGLAPVHRLGVPVVSIGNITLGGTGKTPLTIHIARRMAKAGIRPMILSRGYGSRGTGTRIVSDGKTVLLGADEAGDEPVLMAQRLPDVPVVVDPNRVRGAMAAIERLQPGIILLDDGFQHRRIARDLDIVLLDAIDPFGRYDVFPSGFLREPFAGLSRADVFVVTRAPDSEPLETLTSVLRRYNPSAPILRATHVPEALVPVGAANGPPPGNSPPGERTAGGGGDFGIAPPGHGGSWAGSAGSSIDPAGVWRAVPASELDPAPSTLDPRSVSPTKPSAGQSHGIERIDSDRERSQGPPGAGSNGPLDPPSVRPTQASAGQSHGIEGIDSDRERSQGSPGAGSDGPLDIGRLAGVPVFAFCAIGNPEGFRTTLHATGARLIGFESFRDHHVYSRLEIERLAAAARHAGAALLLTTEKDAIRIPAGTLVPPLLALRIRMEVVDEHLLLDPILALARSTGRRVDLAPGAGDNVRTTS